MKKPHSKTPLDFLSGLTSLVIVDADFCFKAIIYTRVNYYSPEYLVTGQLTADKFKSFSRAKIENEKCSE